MSVLYGVPLKTTKTTVQLMQHATLSPLDDDSLLEALAELSASNRPKVLSESAYAGSSQATPNDFELQVKTIEPSHIPLHLHELSVHKVGADKLDALAAGTVNVEDGALASEVQAPGRLVKALGQDSVQFKDKSRSKPIKSIARHEDRAEESTEERSKVSADAQPVVSPLVSPRVSPLVGSKVSSEVNSEVQPRVKAIAEHRVVIRNFTKLDDEALSYILSYRNSDSVRFNMLSTDLLSLEGHLKFCHDLKQRPNKLYLLSAFDGYPMSVASIHADESWSRLLDYGMYAVGTTHPERSSALEGRIPVYEIDRVVIAHLVLSRGIKAVDFQFKLDNTKSIYVNLNKLQTHVLRQDDKLLYTRLDCLAPAFLYQKQLHDFCVKYHCTLEFDL